MDKKIESKEVSVISIAGKTSKEKWDQLIEKIDKFCLDNKIVVVKTRRSDEGDDRCSEYVFKKNDALKVKAYLKKII